MVYVLRTAHEREHGRERNYFCHAYFRSPYLECDWSSGRLAFRISAQEH